jgi:zinc finger SWIM domain-containing protein 3
MSYPENRRMNHQIEEAASALLNLKVPSSVFNEQLKSLSGKQLTCQDIKNLKQKLKREKNLGNSALVLFCERLDKIVKEVPHANIQLTVNNEGEISCIFIQLPHMKTAYNKFPEVCLLDATYNVNNIKMPLYTLMVEDGYGASIPVAHMLVVNEETSTLDSAFTCFKECAVATGDTKVFLIDKDFTEIAVVKKHFPTAKIQLCRFHVIRTFKKETTNIANNVRDKLRECLQSLVYCNTEKSYEDKYTELQTIAPQSFMDYFNKNWHKMKEMWVNAWRKKHSNMGNATTNRLESYHHKLKKTMKASDSISTCVEELVNMSANKEKLTVRNNILSITTCHYNQKHRSVAAEQINSVCTQYSSKFVIKELAAMKHSMSLAQLISSTDDMTDSTQHRVVFNNVNHYVTTMQTHIFCQERSISSNF